MKRDFTDLGLEPSLTIVNAFTEHPRSPKYEPSVVSINVISLNGSYFATKIILI
jgi:hypothetical protein